MRGSYNKITTLCNNKYIYENKKYLSSLEQSGWFEFIYQIIKSSVDIVISLKVKLKLKIKIRKTIQF